MLSAVGFPDWEQRPSLQMMVGSMLMLNPPQHRRLRRLVSRSFTAQRIAGLRDAISQIADEHCEPLDGTVEFLDAIAFPLPVAVIGELLGIPAADRAMFQPLVREWTSVLEFLHQLASDQADMTASEMRRYLGELAQIRRAEPADDLISALVVDEDEGQQLSEDELVTMVRADPPRGV